MRAPQSPPKVAPKAVASCVDPGPGSAAVRAKSSRNVSFGSLGSVSAFTNFSCMSPTCAVGPPKAIRPSGQNRSKKRPNDARLDGIDDDTADDCAVWPWLEVASNGVSSAITQRLEWSAAGVEAVSLRACLVQRSMRSCDGNGRARLWSAGVCEERDGCWFRRYQGIVRREASGVRGFQAREHSQQIAVGIPVRLGFFA